MNGLGIEIGGTKLQLGIGAGDGKLLALSRRPIDAGRGAEAILQSIHEAGNDLLQHWDVQRIGVGFGGPVQDGVVVKSHQVRGWENFALRAWCERCFEKPVQIANDCDAAALAEALHGAGQGASGVFYVTVGTGVGGGLVLDGRLQGQHQPAVAEIGHLRPGVQAGRPEQTVESVASGWGIAAQAAARVRGDVTWPVHRLGVSNDREQRQREIAISDELSEEYAADLLTRCKDDLERLTAVDVAAAAAEGNQLAADSLSHAVETLGWAIAQMVTLTAVDKVVVGGGVSLLGESMFFQPLRTACERYVFPPLKHAYQIVPAALGEEVVVHGAIAVAMANN